MHAWEAVQKTLNYMEDHLGEEIQIETLSGIAGLSLFYYQRLFTRLVKKPVREYIKLRRLARVCEALRHKENRILDVAVAYGFGSHEVFTRAFKSAYGITPAQYRESRISLMTFDKPDLLLKYVITDEGVPLLSDGLVLEMNRKTLEEPILFLGLTECFPFFKGPMRGEKTGTDYAGGTWARYFEMRPAIPRIPGGRVVGVHYHGDAPDGYTMYFVGAESETGEEGAAFDSWWLPAREYVVCGFEAEDMARLTGAALSGAMQYTRRWLREHGLIADGFFPEMYYDNPPEVAYMELWIPFRQREK